LLPEASSLGTDEGRASDNEVVATEDIVRVWCGGYNGVVDFLDEAARGGAHNL
jgi:hypothetical protein